MNKKNEIISRCWHRFKFKLKKMVTAIDSLVKYETAILVSSAFVSKKASGKNGK